jgi:hypothetical protein
MNLKKKDDVGKRIPCWSCGRKRKVAECRMTV